MEIKTKFDVGQKVYMVRLQYKNAEKECPACRGKGIVHLHGEEYRCPNMCCQGKVITRGIKYYSINSVKIKEIEITLNDKKSEIFYYLNNDYSVLIINGEITDKNGIRIFETKKEAEEYRKLKNKEK